MVRPRAGVSAPQRAAALFQGRVVQLDRASAFEAEGCRFEPCRAHLLMHSSDEPVAPQEKRHEGGGEGSDHQEQPCRGPPVLRQTDLREGLLKTRGAAARFVVIYRRSAVAEEPM